MATPPPVPMRSTVVDTVTGWLHRDLVRFLNELRQFVSASAQVVGSIALTAQGAAIVVTNVPTGSLAAGLYRVSYSVRITQAATTSSSVAVTLGWTCNSTSCTQAFAAVTGNTLASQTSDDINIAVDAGTAITYTTSYASMGATSMAYALDVWVEAVP